MSSQPLDGSLQPRTVILKAAADLASLRGLEQLSMGRLAAAIEMSKSGLYAHFTSKQALQLATIDYAYELFEAHVLCDAAGSDGGLAALLDRWLAFYERKVLPGGCFFILAAVECAGRTGPVRDALDARVDRQIAALQTAVRDAQNNGQFSAASDANQTAFALHCILMNTHALFQIKNDRAVFDRARAAIHSLIG